ncbi:MAG: hypothetical protein RR131_07895, partial [Anaerovorax sp.]
MNHTEILFILVKIMFYFSFGLGGFLILKGGIDGYYTQIKMRKRLNARRKMMKEDSALERHLAQLVLVTLKVEISGKNYMVATVLVFGLVLLVGVQSTGFTWSLLLASMSALLPYAVLRAKLESHRTKGSFEGEQLIAELLSQYRICKYNIYMAMEHIIANGKNLKISKKLLFTLLLEIRNTGNGEIIGKATKKFHYSINTNWSRMLAYNIGLAAESGANVSLAFEDILIQLREARLLAEERKRMNAEAGRMVMWVVPVMYVGTVLLSTKYLDITPSKFLYNQLYTSQGFVLLLIIVILFLGNLA